MWKWSIINTLGLVQWVWETWSYKSSVTPIIVDDDLCNIITLFVFVTDTTDRAWHTNYWYPTGVKGLTRIVRCKSRIVIRKVHIGTSVRHPTRDTCHLLQLPVIVPVYLEPPSPGLSLIQTFQNYSPRSFPRPVRLGPRFRLSWDPGTVLSSKRPMTPYLDVKPVSKSTKPSFLLVTLTS